MRIDDAIRKLGEAKKMSGGNTEVYAAVSYKNGVGFHTEEIVNIYFADDVCNIAVSKEKKK